jgi:polyferredoxin
MRFSRFFNTRLLALCLALSTAPALGAGIDAAYPQVRGFFPQADRFGAVAGEPPAAPVYRGKDLLGYVFLTFDVVRIPAYSGRPINTLVGFDLSGRITGVQIVGHEEPILLAGISENQLQRFVAQYRDKGVFDRISVGGTRAGHVTIDTISGATVTVMVENATLMQSVRKVALARGLDPARPATPNAAGTIAGAARTAPPEPIWIGVWHERVFPIAVLGAGLVFLTLVLIFQDWLARRSKLLLYVRDGFLLFTLFFIGWYGLAQLSVVNVLTFSHSIMHGFQWESFLIDPLMFILWAFVAVTLLLWGRSVYCGWLCPFGALQELTFQLARRFKRLPFFEMPQAVHERLWALKYIILLVLFGASLQSLSQAEYLAEVEPFKTAVTLRWGREWGFVLFAAAMVLVSAFNRKFYCKYLCALGAALTIPGKFRIFDWLRRHRECGRPCQVCARECEVQAIRKNGEINANECHYCLDCQVTYWNDRKCPPEVERRRRRQKSVRARELVRGMESMLGPSGIEEVPARGDPAPRAGRDPSGCAGCKYLSDK